jgi:hypothetical protein
MKKFVGRMSIACVVLAAVFGTVAPAADAEDTYVQGAALQMMQMDGRSFTYDGANIHGLAFPVTMMCPGSITLVDGSPVCSDSGIDGFQGMNVTIEKVTRYYVSNANRQHPFVMNGPQRFSGWLWVGGKRYHGTATLQMHLNGVLRKPADVDCYAEPQNMTCGAAHFTGTWKIVPGEGTGDLRNMTGSGTLEWLGCTNWNDSSTCSLPVYKGTIQLNR